jgi:N-acetylneuraminic acid mutarotase
MASIAQDRQGNMMLGFSTSNGTAPNYPSIAYTGRLVGDPLGQMPQGEAVMTVGTGSQTGTAGRWGDYSMMGIDPVDDCTFWYTNEYLTTTGGAPWRTRIGYMKFPNCSGGTPTPTATGPQPTATNTPAPPSPTPTACGSPAQWTAGPNFPSTMVRAWGAWFPPNNRFYSMGGRMSDAVGSDLLNPHEYNPATNAWTVKAAAFPDGDVNNMVGGVLNGPSGWRIYTVGGSAAGGTTATARVMVYDPVADTLTELTTDPWTGNAAGDTLPGGAAVHNNRLYVFGGFQINIGMTNTIWEFNPMAAAGARWTQKTATLPEALGYIPATTIGNFIYTAGGSAWDGTTIADTDFSYRYDPVADTLTTITSIPRFTAETRALTVDGTMWVLGGGRDAPNPSNEVNVYDPATNSWSLGPSFNLARRNFAADIDPASGEIYIAGGYAPTTATDSMEIYTPEVPCATATPTVAPATATATAAPSWQLYLPAIFLNADTP